MHLAGDGDANTGDGIILDGVEYGLDFSADFRESWSVDFVCDYRSRVMRFRWSLYKGPLCCSAALFAAASVIVIIAGIGWLMGL